MKTRITSVLVLMTLLFTLGGSALALADSARKITGSMQFNSWGHRIWLHTNVHEVNPETHEAEGRCAWKMYNEEQGWRYLVTRVTCVTFGADIGEDPRTAVFSGQILSKEGYGPGEKGQWFRFWVRDGGVPSRNLDQWASQTHGVFPDEFWPEDEEPGCDYFWPGESENSSPPIDVEKGNLTIH